MVGGIQESVAESTSAGDQGTEMMGGTVSYRSKDEVGGLLFLAGLGQQFVQDVAGIVTHRVKAI